MLLLVQCDFPDLADGITPHRRTATCAGPVKRPRRTLRLWVADDLIPKGELASVGLQGVHHALSNSLTGHLTCSLQFSLGQHRGNTELESTGISR